MLITVKMFHDLEKKSCILCNMSAVIQFCIQRLVRQHCLHVCILSLRQDYSHPTLKGNISLLTLLRKQGFSSTVSHQIKCAPEKKT